MEKHQETLGSTPTPQKGSSPPARPVRLRAGPQPEFPPSPDTIERSEFRFPETAMPSDACPPWPPSRPVPSQGLHSPPRLAAPGARSRSLPVPPHGAIAAREEGPERGEPGRGSAMPGAAGPARDVATATTGALGAGPRGGGRRSIPRVPGRRRAAMAAGGAQPPRPQIPPRTLPVPRRRGLGLIRGYLRRGQCDPR